MRRRPLVHESVCEVVGTELEDIGGASLEDLLIERLDLALVSFR